MTVADFINLFLAALLLAGIYAVMSVGMTIVYGVMKIVNLAHAGFIMFGAYFCYELHERIGIDPILAAIAALPVFFGLGMAVHGLLIRWLPRSDQPTLASLLLMFGFWLVLQNLAYVIWGNSDRAILTPRTTAILSLGPVVLSQVRLAVFVAAASSFVALELVLHRSWFGRAIRASTQNPYAARIVGVDEQKIFRLAFGLGTSFAGFAGGLMAMLYSFNPDFGGAFLVRAFVIIVLGGLESIAGVALGALVLALLETFSILIIPASYQPALAFSLLVVVLLFIPTGIAGSLGARPRLARARPNAG
jgi:branched-chain amino acid transport system permease protein